MDIKAYIESGILELYALDQLAVQKKLELERLLIIYPELNEELTQIHDALEHLAMVTAVAPTLYLKDRIVEQIENQDKELRMDLNNLPLINKFSNVEAWRTLLSNFDDLEPNDGQKVVKVLRNNHDVIQLLIASKSDIEEEVHAGELESFLILEGTCICTVSGIQRSMGSGDYMEIPLYESHDVRLTSNKVVAILQHLKI
jgi:mannose-6-phosphate isomerase-like protein (cupin superfamily)